MLDGNHIYSIISLIVGVLMLSLGLYVFGLNRNVKVANALILAMCSGSLAAVADFLMMNVAEEGIALLLAQFAFFFTVALFGGFLYIAIALPYESEGSWIVKKKLTYSFLVAFSGIIPAFSISGMVESSYGWGVPPDAGFWIWVFVLIFYTVAAVFILTQIGLSSKSTIVRKQCSLMSAAIAFPLLYNFLVEGLDQQFNMGFPSLLATGFLVTAMLLTFVVMKTDIFVLEPVKGEAQLEERKKVASLPTGTCRLLEGKKPDAAYTAFIEEVARGSQGLLISRVHPDHVQEKYGPVTTPIIWLTSQPGQQRIDPTSLSILQHTIIDFMQKGSHSVVLLDGLEYLISNNSADKVIRVIYTLKDTAVTSGSKLIIPLDPNILNVKELALFERELETDRMDMNNVLEA